MSSNRIRSKRAEIGITQAELAKRMPDGVNTVAMNFIESGKVIPTKESLDALCEVFQCRPEDLYDSSDLNVLGAEVEESDKSGTIVLSDILSKADIEVFHHSLAFLGYEDMKEWIREAIRKTVWRYVALSK